MAWQPAWRCCGRHAQSPPPAGRNRSTSITNGALPMHDDPMQPFPLTTMVNTPEAVMLVPIARIEVLNSRERNAKVFNEIVDNIRTIGLKKPITVTRREGPDGQDTY